MWSPDLSLRADPGYGLLLVALHLVAGVALWQLAPWGLALLPLLLLSMGVTVAKHSLRVLARSPVRVRLGVDGWYLQARNGAATGPLRLHSDTRLGVGFIRLSFTAGGWRRRHLLLTRTMLGREDFRRLQVFLRWCPELQQALGSAGQPASAGSCSDQASAP